MECLAGSTTRIFAPDNHINELKESLILPRSANLCTKSTSCIRIMQHLHSKSRCYSVTSFSHPSLSSPAAQAIHCLPSSNSGVLGTELTGHGKSVKVKFQMEEECQFGDHFFMVGDDSILGSWNPSDAIPFDWSEGHMWSLVLEMPVEKSIKYKFLLKKSSGEIMWQLGPDRVFQSWKTENVIVVSEQWGSAEAQKISEEQQNTDGKMEIIGKTQVDQSFVGSPKCSEQAVPTEADNIRVSGFDGNACAEDCPGTGNRSVLNVDNGAYLKENPSSSASSTKKGRSSQKELPTKKEGTRGVRVDQSLAEEDEGSLVIYDEGPVLVPGLTLPLMSSGKAHVKEQQSILADTSVGADAPRNQSVPDGLLS